MEPRGEKRAIGDDKTGFGQTPGFKFIRQFDHVEGNWPSSVSLTLSDEVQIPSDYMSKIISHFVDTYKAKLPHCTLDNLVIVPTERLHVSLSKSFTLRHHQIDNFVNDLKDEICVLYPLRYSIKPEYYILLNETKTRLFLCLPIDDHLQDNFPNLVQAVDKTLSKYKKEKYYTNPTFHMSIASAVIRDPSDFDDSINLGEYHQLDLNEILFIDLNKLQCQIGDHCYVMNIKDNLTIWPKDWELL